MTGPVTEHLGDAEIKRIRDEYARREAQIPSDVYGWQRAVNRYYHTQVYRAVIEALVQEAKFPLNGMTVADIGCGNGSWLLEFVQWGADPYNLVGIDLLESRVQSARRKLPTADICVGDARTTKWSSSSFDIVTQFTLFTSMLDPAMKKQIAAEMLRILRPSGIIIWFDFRYGNPANPNVAGIGSREIRELFSGCTVRLRSILLAPPIARRIAEISWMSALALEMLPFLRTHYLGIIRRPQ
jgi:ubiquinone/menaquinone biosynthesis C-methylase UbiE